MWAPWQLALQGEESGARRLSATRMGLQRKVYLRGKDYKRKKSMIIIPVKDGENIERALKRFKRKFDRTGTMREIRRRQAFDKPSVLRRQEIEHAKYIQQLQDREEM